MIFLRARPDCRYNDAMESIIKKPDDLVTSREQTRAGFLSFALEKNRQSTPVIESAKSFRELASHVTTARELLHVATIRSAMLTATGLSDKSLKYLTEQDKNEAIAGLIENFLEPAGEHFADEAVYRYLLFKGDSLGGTMRNIFGALAQRKLIRAFLSNLSVAGISYQWIGATAGEWSDKPSNDYAIEEHLKALRWMNSQGEVRVLAFNLTIPLVGNNVDICLFCARAETCRVNELALAPETIVMLGELKGGIDPAGADERWKTGNTALTRIREAFAKNRLNVHTSFLAAAIEKKMADEIFTQLKNSTLSCAANVTIDAQLIHYCDWLLKISS